MKQFFKFFTASCLGTLAALGLIAGVFALIGMSNVASKNKVAKGSLLTLDLNRVIPEKSKNVDSNISFTDAEKTAVGIHDIKALIKHAINDENIQGLVIYSSGMTAELSDCYNLLTSLKEFKASDKPIYMYGDFLSQADYMLGSIADTVAVNINGYLDIRGFKAMYPFYKDMLDKLGIEMNVFYAGEFKGGSEPYRLNKMSDENRFQTREFLDDLYLEFINKIAENRSLDPVAFREGVTNLSFMYPEDALENKLIDIISYKDDFKQMLKDRFNIDEKKKLATIDIASYYDKTYLKKSGSGKDKIAVVYAEGEIQFNNEGNGVISEVKYVPLLNKIRKDKNVKAVVLRVNSPGGNSYSSEQIWECIEDFKEDNIPVIASYGNYAASGGYYISCNAQTIVSEPNTLTGSIGVFSLFPNVTELFEEKLGIHFDTVKTSKYAVSFSPYFELRDDEEAIMIESTKRLYKQFLQRVAKGRNMDVDQVDKIARGRVWTGKQALENGLVDKIGTLEDAIEIAASLAGLENYRLVEYPKIKENQFVKFVQQVMSSQDVSMPMSNLGTIEKEWLSKYLKLRTMMENKQPQMSLPFELKI